MVKKKKKLRKKEEDNDAKAQNLMFLRLKGWEFG
jgi:hypothetical protein